MTSPGLETPYWSQDAAAVSAAVGAGLDGLSTDSAAATLRLVGPNSVEEAAHLSALRLLMRQFESPLVLILIFAAAVSLSAGNLIPADGLVIEAADFLVSEASMTGESFSVEKRPGIVKPEAAAKALGPHYAATLLARADEVME